MLTIYRKPITAAPACVRSKHKPVAFGLRFLIVVWPKSNDALFQLDARRLCVRRGPIRQFVVLPAMAENYRIVYVYLSFFLFSRSVGLAVDICLSYTFDMSDSKCNEIHLVGKIDENGLEGKKKCPF